MSRNSHLIALLLFVAVGCAPDRPAGPGGPESLSDAEAQLVGREVAGEVEDVAGSFTLTGLLDPSFPTAASTVSRGLQPTPTATCPTITPNPPVDTDGDGVPDDVTLTFTLPDCATTRNGTTFEITGAIHVTDPSTTRFGIRVEFTDLQHKVTRADGAFFLNRLDGVRQALASGAGFSLVDSTTADRESSEYGVAQLAKAWVVSFVADPNTTVSHSRRLPSGDLSVEGKTTWTRRGVSHSLMVSTPTPLHHDTTCTTRPAFTSGELTIVKTGPDGTVTIHVVFNGCGVEPTITVERTSV